MTNIAIGLVALSLLISSDSALAGDPRGHAGKGTGQQTPATISEIFAEVDKHLTALDRAVVKGDLHRIHEVAFETRDLLLTIPPKATSLSDKGKSDLQKSLKKIRQQAALLDKYGDAGNTRMTKVVLGKFKTEIQSIKKMMGTKQN